MASALGGCATRAQVLELERAAQAREERIAAMEAQLAGSAELAATVAAAEGRVRELQQILEQATSAVARNSADVVTEVERLRTDLGALQGQLAEARNDVTTARTALQQRIDEVAQQVERLASQMGVDLALAESEIPADVNAHFDAAKQAFDRQDWARARALFRVFTTRYPRHEKADDAHYYVGMTYMQQNRPQNAISPFQRVIQDYRTGDMVDDTLLKMGDAFFQIRACDDARTAYEALLSGHRNSPHAAAARRGLTTVRGATRAQCTP